MSRPLATCQCKRARNACTRTASQEDLWCDVCRVGCSQFGFAPVGTPAEDITVDGHYELLNFSFSIGTP